MKTAWRLPALLLPLLLLASACDRIGTLADDLVDEEDTDLASAGVQAVTPAVIPVGVDTATVEEGRRLYVVCAVCHGLDGHGTGLGPSLRDGEWRHISGSVEEIATITRSGVTSPVDFPIPMPAMGGGDYAPEEVQAVAAYVFALGHE